MLDNFYVVKQTFRQIEEDLPASFLNQLPKLDGTSLQGHPRIFALAREWIGYSQSQIDLTQAAIFVQDYQQVTPLTIGELWALPIMLRIGILERLVYAAAELTGMEAPKSLSEIPNSVRCHRRCQTRPLSPTVFSACACSPPQIGKISLSRPAGWNRFCAMTLRRFMRAWILTPATVIAVSSRNWRATQTSAKNKLRSLQLNLPAVRKTKLQGGKRTLAFICGMRGVRRSKTASTIKPDLVFVCSARCLHSPPPLILGSIAILSVLFVLGLLTYATLSGGSPVQLIIAGLLGFGLALEAAITLVHWNVTHRIKPQSLPRMDFSEGIPAGNRTMVVVPTLLESADELNHLLQELELYYLSNPDPQLTYALLTDFGDAPTEHMPEDEQLLALASAGIENLNKKYAKASPFYLFHRQRQWNPSEGVWMGWERKRGKLADFNRLLLNLGETPTQPRLGMRAF